MNNYKKYYFRFHDHFRHTHLHFHYYLDCYRFHSISQFFIHILEFFSPYSTTFFFFFFFKINNKKNEKLF